VTYVGTSVKRGDDPRLLTGRGRYVDDLTLPRRSADRDAPPRDPCAGDAGGFKGAGEAGATGAPAAILNAVNDALAPLGVMLTDQPITPERVMQALRQKR